MWEAACGAAKYVPTSHQGTAAELPGVGCRMPAQRQQRQRQRAACSAKACKCNSQPVQGGTLLLQEGLGVRKLRRQRPPVRQPRQVAGRQDLQGRLDPGTIQRQARGSGWLRHAWQGRAPHYGTASTAAGGRLWRTLAPKPYSTQAPEAVPLAAAAAEGWGARSVHLIR